MHLHGAYIAEKPAQACTDETAHGLPIGMVNRCSGQTFVESVALIKHFEMKICQFFATPGIMVMLSMHSLVACISRSGDFCVDSDNR